jgi:hypothetical protein
MSALASALQWSICDIPAPTNGRWVGPRCNFSPQALSGRAIRGAQPLAMAASGAPNGQATGGCPSIGFCPLIRRSQPAKLQCLAAQTLCAAPAGPFPPNRACEVEALVEETWDWADGHHLTPILLLVHRCGVVYLLTWTATKISFIFSI